MIFGTCSTFRLRAVRIDHTLYCVVEHGGRRQAAPYRIRREWRELFIRRPATATLAVIGARKPAVCFRRSEQASIAFTPIDTLTELA